MHFKNINGIYRGEGLGKNKQGMTKHLSTKKDVAEEGVSYPNIKAQITKPLSHA
jgi:hypothetical protein